jgi:hypothetical protein
MSRNDSKFNERLNNIRLFVVHNGTVSGFAGGSRGGNCEGEIIGSII